MPDYKTVCTILSELWENYRDDEDFSQFIEYNDLGLPMAYCLAEGLVTEITNIGQRYITETFDLLLAALSIDIDNVQDGMSLTDLFNMAQDKK